MAIKKIKSIKHIGKFGNFSSGNDIALGRFSVIYAENGRGKTTLSAIFRSLKTFGNLKDGESDPILDRKRIASSNDDKPYVEFNMSEADVIFQDGNWIGDNPDIDIFDDHFVSNNVCSGIEVDIEHRRGMHSVIIGYEGVQLNNSLKECKKKAQEQKKIRDGLEKAIANEIGKDYNVNDFCELPPSDNIDSDIAKAKQLLKSARASDDVLKHSKFLPLKLPELDLDAACMVLQKSLPDLETDASKSVQSHLDRLGVGGEKWIVDGMPYIENASTGLEHRICPFCAQRVDSATLLSHYKSHFSEAYKSLKSDIEGYKCDIEKEHSDNAIASFESCVRDLLDLHKFWKNHIEISDIEIDVQKIKTQWVSARNSLLESLHSKSKAPLEIIEISENAKKHIADFQESIGVVIAISNGVLEYNAKIGELKSKIESSNIQSIEKDLARLEVRKKRFEPSMDKKCKDYLLENGKMKTLENEKKQAQRELDEYQEDIFSKHEEIINMYLSKFGVGFRITSIKSKNDAGGYSVQYSIEIDKKEISLNAKEGPSFSNTLSAGDRSTLAFAFFLASIDHEDNLGKKIIIIDDPVTSLDGHRIEMTSECIKDLAEHANQVIVLSHSRSFLHKLWMKSKKACRNTVFSALQISRKESSDGFSSSEIELWDVASEDATMYDMYHELARDYVDGKSYTKERKIDVGSALRKLLEGYLRVSCAEHCPDGFGLGSFVDKCEQKVDKPDEILVEKDVNELRSLKDYLNDFHHYKNESEVNDEQLLSYAKRTLKFCSRSHNISV